MKCRLRFIGRTSQGYRRWKCDARHDHTITNRTGVGPYDLHVAYNAAVVIEVRTQPHGLYALTPVRRRGWGTDCHRDCVLGPNRDHPGYLEYRCQDSNGNSLPFPGEPLNWQYT